MSTKLPPWLSALVLSTSSIALLSGCVEASEQFEGLTEEAVVAMSSDEGSAGHEEQATALADGRVTREEYEAAFGDLTACLASGGYQIGATWTSPIDGYTILFRVDGEGVSESQKAESVEACMDEYWDSVSAVYQDTATPNMDESLRRGAIDCIRGEGFELSGDESTPREMAGPNPIVDGVPSDQLNAATICLIETQNALFPEIETSAVTLR